VSRVGSNFEAEGDDFQPCGGAKDFNPILKITQTSRPREHVHKDVRDQRQLFRKAIFTDAAARVRVLFVAGVGLNGMLCGRLAVDCAPCSETVN